MKTLIVEDDFTCRLLLQAFLSRFGECHVAVNGNEAVAAFRTAAMQYAPYDLVCMDIMMPEMNGQEAAAKIRAFEEEHGVLSHHGSKIIMTTSMSDPQTVKQAFQSLVDAYLVKPLDTGKLLGHLKKFGLLNEADPAAELA